MAFVFKAWEDLTIQDDFMFKAVMKNKDVCKGVLAAILDEPIHDIKYLGEELSLKAGYASKGVRLDVYVEDAAHTVYDVEMQVGSESDEELAKRMRYYQSQIDAELLSRGRDYVNSGIISANPLVQSLDKRVREVKRNEAERLSYMKYELNLRDARKDGKEEGLAEGRAEERALLMRIWQMFQEKISFPEIALRTDLSLEEVEQIARGFGVAY